MHRIDSNGATVDHKFTDTPISGQNATVVDDDWLNAVQEELCNFLENFGVTLTKGTNTQLSTLMGSLLAASALLTKIKSIPRSDAALDVDLLDGLHASAFATSAQGTKADSALQGGSQFATSSQGTKADNADISDRIGGGDVPNAGSLIKTKLIYISLSGSTASVAHGIAGAYSSHKIIGVDCIYADGGYNHSINVPDNTKAGTVYWDDTNIYLARVSVTGTYIYYLTIRYV
jgi:hypothetical protein